MPASVTIPTELLQSLLDMTKYVEGKSQEQKNVITQAKAYIPVVVRYHAENEGKELEVTINGATCMFVNLDEQPGRLGGMRPGSLCFVDAKYEEADGNGYYRCFVPKPGAF